MVQQFRAPFTTESQFLEALMVMRVTKQTSLVETLVFVGRQECDDII